MTIVGTRPEIVRLSRVLSRLDETSGIEHVLVHTGQNYDYELSQVFFEDLGLRPPDIMFGVDTSSLGTVLGGILVGTEEVLAAERPDALLVLGDTNSCISALMARRMQIPVYHMEAGNRSFDLNVPEEINRRLVDHVSDFNLVYTEHARRNLLSEGIHPRRILKTGSPMMEIIGHYRASIQASDIHSRLGLEPGAYFLVSAHRQENVDAPERLTALLSCLQALGAAYALPIYVSTHPRTRKRLDALPDAVSLPNVIFGEPLGFHDYNRLQLDATCVLSDSGTIAEESSILGFAAITLRSQIERPEALDAGSITMTDLDPWNVVAGVGFAQERSRRDDSRLPEDYQIADTSSRVVNFILSTALRSNAWDGIRSSPSSYWMSQ